MPLWVVFFGLFLMFAGMSLIFSIYLCLLWCVARDARWGHDYGANNNNHRPGLAAPEAAAAAAAPSSGNYGKNPAGLTALDLQMLPGGGEAAAAAASGRECPVCLEDIQPGQPARVLPSCGHGFHRRCADQWLMASPACPICRAAVPRLASSGAVPPHQQNPAAVAAPSPLAAVPLLPV